MMTAPIRARIADSEPDNRKGPIMYAQPIATAPKDGTLILGLDHRGWREMWWVIGGQDYADYWQDNYDSEPEPTHWCQLPIIEKHSK